MKNKNNLIILISIFVAIILIGTTFAYFSSRASTAIQTVTTGSLQVQYVSGLNISANNMYPVPEDEAKEHHFTINNIGNLNALYKIRFTDISLTKNSQNITTNNLKWSLYRSDNSYVISGDALATGDFGSDSSFVAGNTTLDIINNQTLEATLSQSYVLKVWLNETGFSQNEDQEIEFSTKITVEALEL